MPVHTNSLRTCLLPAEEPSRHRGALGRQHAGAPTRDLREEVPVDSACLRLQLGLEHRRAATWRGFQKLTSSARTAAALLPVWATRFKGDDEARPAARGVSKGLTKGGCR